MYLNHSIELVENVFIFRSWVIHSFDYFQALILFRRTFVFFLSGNHSELLIIGILWSYRKYVSHIHTISGLLDLFLFSVRMFFLLFYGK